MTICCVDLAHHRQRLQLTRHGQLLGQLHPLQRLQHQVSRHLLKTLLPLPVLSAKVLSEWDGTRSCRGVDRRTVQCPVANRERPAPNDGSNRHFWSSRLSVRRQTPSAAAARRRAQVNGDVEHLRPDTNEQQRRTAISTDVGLQEQCERKWIQWWRYKCRLVQQLDGGIRAEDRSA